MTDPLTSDEHMAIQQAGELWGTLCKIVKDGPTRDADLAELIVHIHAIQRSVMAQAAARVYPDGYRLLGSTLPRPPKIDFSAFMKSQKQGEDHSDTPHRGERSPES